ncbi:MAG: hypothetical protein V1724_00950 [Chloroflexota bacterium]
MALRLAGERALAIQGVDNQGWVREVTVQDSLPGLKINQKGTGRVFDFQDSGVSKMYLPDGGNVTLVGSLVFDLANDVTVTPANPAAPRTLTIPDPGSDDTFVFLAATQTLTGKTLTSPTIQGTVGGGTGLTMPAFVAGGAISTASGSLTLSPASNVIISSRSITGIVQLRPVVNENLVLTGHNAVTQATPFEVQLATLDPAADVDVKVAAAVPTATPTTPFWAQRGDVTIPVAAALPASFLTFRWDPANDQVSVYVNDGGVIRSAVIGTVV